MEQDKKIVADIQVKADQANRNAKQGELGITLAMNKVNEIKL